MPPFIIQSVHYKTTGTTYVVERKILHYLVYVLQSNIPVVIVNDDQKDVTILVYLFIPNQLYMFRAISSPIIRST